MAVTFFKPCIVSFFFFLHLYTSSSKQLASDFYKGRVHALYVFGDSLVDPGNNNNLPIKPKSNFLPYGIDFEGGKATGRSTNGKTVADFIAIHYGLPLTPPYLGVSDSWRSNVITGINYASGGCGILPESGQKLGGCLSLDNQTELFQTTVENDLPKKFNTQKELHKHLAESLFFVSIGVNDYSLYDDQESSVPPETFSQFLLNQFSMRLQRLYRLGARKFLINNIPPAGCFPTEVIKMTPKGTCNEHKNHILAVYNKNLPNMLKHLQSQLPASSFVHSNYFKFLMELRGKARNNSTNITFLTRGLRDKTHPCCPKHYNGNDGCLPNSSVCKSRDTHMFFDPYHPSEISNYMYVVRCFHESSICSPLDH